MRRQPTQPNKEIHSFHLGPQELAKSHEYIHQDMDSFTTHGHCLQIDVGWKKRAMMIGGDFLFKVGGRSKQQGSLAYPEHTFRARAELAEVLWRVRRRAAEPGSTRGPRGLTCRGRMRGAEMDEIS